ncbi:ABC transporter ATP-binding protein [Paenibacillus aceris]|uniref:Iron(III) transport system ATP-binding protein n=1 Tax=Paenibacillus aceris TaxID=869555 RepID=A0ABS4I5I6_9BACL|nr:ABC transporter ATP-binding protein [Paenibacillus aceris]MBP1966182.1 iron(III) transport system ATP-binding protein [Paenibacillus aceris]NHW33337.1 ABC transporter ATP-binding protein [Paenibacillus aceris]
MSVAIHVNHITKKYDNGNITIIPDLSVKIKNGEFFTLLGPSGCGKTTLLRMIAGFNSIEAGEISFDDTIINSIPAHKRNIGMVFQNYAIFPHLTVQQNVEYGLKLRKLPKNEIQKKTDEIMKVVKIDQYKDRLPEKLSGGQQQRVALARSIVIRPSVLLMDEPLSNLDAKLRVDMRTAIRDIQKEVGITTVYVTHDQEEALAISDRIAVMKDGVIQQVGKPRDIYTRPANIFVSSFIGHSNFFKGHIELKGNEKRIVFKDGFSLAMPNLVDAVKDGQSIIITVRPEEFTIADNGLKATINKSTFLGQYINYEVHFNDDMMMEAGLSSEFVQDLGNANKFYELKETLYLAPKSEKINVFTEDGEQSLIKDVRKYD